MSTKLARQKRLKLHSESSDVSTSSFSSSSSSDESTDAKDLKPIKEYLSDRKELAVQLFKSVKPEKIRLMLPQILKKCEISELEELCANEVTGMSKKRILCILNGQEMLQSSDTDDTDDSGPSLEIISDTEWLSDDELGIKKDIPTSKPSKKKEKENTSVKKKKKADPKEKTKVKTEKPEKSMKVKKEKIKTEGKEKEKKQGESLLDLLELEMRARAIRALIRKEEDVVGNKNQNKTANNASSSNSKPQSSQEHLKKIEVALQQGDEDIFVVVNQAPTIELISSESETEHVQTIPTVVQEPSSRPDNKKENVVAKDSGKAPENEKQIQPIKLRRNHRLENERGPEDTIKDNDSIEIEKVSKNKIDPQPIKLRRNHRLENERLNDITKSENVAVSELKTTEPQHSPQNDKDTSLNDNISGNNDVQKKRDCEEGEISDEGANEKETVETNNVSVKNNDSQEKISKKPKAKKDKKRKKKLLGKTKSNKKPNFNTYSDMETSDKEEIKVSHVAKNKGPVDETTKASDNVPETIESKDSPRNGDNENIDIFDEKLDEIIDLDDYPDDIEDLDVRCESPKNPERDSGSNKESDIEKKAETWAQRYFQQDEVQNVIKESKIQSEIRKRLRERQRLTKASNSPKNQEPSLPSPPIIEKPTGSVEEYLALKRSLTVNSNTVTSPAQDLVTQTSEIANNSTDLSTEDLKQSNELVQVTSSKATIKAKPALYFNIEQLKVPKEKNLLTYDSIWPTEEENSQNDQKYKSQVAENSSPVPTSENNDAESSDSNKQIIGNNLDSGSNLNIEEDKGTVS